MEHRYSQRVAIDMPVTLYKRGHCVAEGSVVDVSRTGLFVATDYTEVGQHQPLEVEFSQNGRRPLEQCRFRVVVARVDGGGIGLELDEHSLNGYRALCALVKYFSQRQDRLRQRLMTASVY